jgi:hypothetical protein
MSYASGKKAWGISDRSGFRYRLRDMRKEWTGQLVGPDEYDPKHPQLFPPRLTQILKPCGTLVRMSRKRWMSLSAYNLLKIQILDHSLNHKGTSDRLRWLRHELHLCAA